MTAVYYPDCSATSDGGRYTLEARSPHNGGISYQDGRAPTPLTPSALPEHQREFRYRLLDNRPADPNAREPRVVWERWQGDREGSPHELLVSDGGWSVVRTHGGGPAVIAVSPDGRDTHRVSVAQGEPVREVPARFAASGRFVWLVARTSHTTAGVGWAGDSWRFFFEYAGAPYFSWRAAAGGRLVLDLAGGVAHTAEQWTPPDLLRAAVDEERRRVVAHLEEMSRDWDGLREFVRTRTTGSPEGDIRMFRQMHRARAALHLVSVHRMRECVPFLRAWETVDWPSWTTMSTAIGRACGLEGQTFRPVVQHALKRLGEVPRGLPAYHLTAGVLGMAGGRLPMPEHASGVRGRAAGFRPGATGADVIGTLGPPDFVRKWWREGEWPEVWEYDDFEGGSWVTVRMTWEPDGDGGRLTAVETVPPDWLENDVRVAEYLGY